MTITEFGYLEDDYLVLPYMSGRIENGFGLQSNFTVVANPGQGQEADFKTDGSRATGQQSDVRTTGIEQILSQEAHATLLQHIWKSDETDYLEGPYLTLNYLAQIICANQGMESQFENKLNIPTGEEVQIFNDTGLSLLGQEANKIIMREAPTGMQSTVILTATLSMQSRIVLYNTRNLRILYVFDSRGTEDENWTVSQGGTASGDFDVNNVNTDIVEEVYRSASTQISIDCDTGITQGVSPDTFYIGNHNLTSGALIQVQGSDVSDFSSVNVEFQIDPTETNAYYIVPTSQFPFENSRYWRFNITDTANSDAYVETGAILFGSAVIFQGDCITDQLTRGDKHFKDEIKTEGFTSVSNDRSLKRFVGFSLKNISFGNINYLNFRTASEEIRTSLKALWIPMPRFPDRFGAFAKLSEMPRERHNVKGDANEDLDFIDWDVNVDESL